MTFTINMYVPYYRIRTDPTWILPVCCYNTLESHSKVGRVTGQSIRPQHFRPKVQGNSRQAPFRSESPSSVEPWGKQGGPARCVPLRRPATRDQKAWHRWLSSGFVCFIRQKGAAPTPRLRLPTCSSLALELVKL